MADNNKILIVDDTPENVDVLGSVLSDYICMVALSGAGALEIIQSNPPDIILLDIMMPEMDGFEVCRRLKSNKDTIDIPVIFITAKNRTEDELMGFSLGAVDFISKPISAPIVRARVKTHLALKKAKHVVEEKNAELKLTLKELKETQDHLILSEKMVALGQLISSIAHEINSPIAAIKTSSETIDHNMVNLMEALPKLFKKIPVDLSTLMFEMLDHAKTSGLQLTTREERKIMRSLESQLDEKGFDDSRYLSEKFTEIGIYDNIDAYIPILNSNLKNDILYVVLWITTQIRSSITVKAAIDRVTKIIFALKNYARYDNSGETSEAVLSDGINAVLTLYNSQIKNNIILETTYLFENPISCYPGELDQVWTNLIHNALQAMDYKGRLSIRTFEEDKYAVVSIKDSGKGIPEEIRKKIFDPFFSTKPLGEGSGLGLDIVKKIIDKHQGRIELDSKIDIGTEFRIFLPLNNKV